jgi:AcrR family transcriptional regulator
VGVPHLTVGNVTPGLLGYGPAVETRSERRRNGREARERQILDAAVEVFSEQGFHAASLDEIAERVGLAKPVLDTHFESKDGLFDACLARARTELLEVTSAAAALADSPEGMLRLSTHAYFDHLERNGAMWRLLRAEPVMAGHALEGVRAQQTAFVASLLAERAPHVDPYRLAGWAQAIAGAAERLADWRASVGTVSAAQATDCLMDVVWNGLGVLDQHNGGR